MHPKSILFNGAWEILRGWHQDRIQHPGEPLHLRTGRVHREERIRRRLLGLGRRFHQEGESVWEYRWQLRQQLDPLRDTLAHGLQNPKDYLPFLLYS